MKAGNYISIFTEFAIIFSKQICTILTTFYIKISNRVRYYNEIFIVLVYIIYRFQITDKLKYIFINIFFRYVILF